MKYIVSALLLLSMVGCSTAGYRGPASQKLTKAEKLERSVEKYDRFTGN